MGFGTPVVGTETTASAATVTPGWKQATTAGNLGLALVLANNIGAVTGPSNWSSVGPVNNVSQFTLWYKLNLGTGESNPSFTSSSATVMKAFMVEVPVSGGVAALDQSGSSTKTTSPITATAGAPDATATDIAISGSAWRNNTNTSGTFSHSAGFTNLLNDGSSTSTAHIAGAYQILSSGGSSADADTTSFTGGVKDAAAAIASFKIANTTTTKTQTGVARITVTTTKTQTGVARIQVTTPQTQSGRARIQVTTSQTQTGKANIAGGNTTTTRTQTGKADIRATTTKTQGGKARVQVTNDKTQTGKARIQIRTTRTQSGVARIQARATKTQSGKARVQLVTDKTQAGKANVRATTTRTQTGVTRIAGNITTTRTQTGVARIGGTYGGSAGPTRRVVVRDFRPIELLEALDGLDDLELALLLSGNPNELG